MTAIKPIYLDYAATTPVDPRVAQRMLACLTQPLLQGNPASLTHEYGRQARDLIETARVQVAAALHSEPASMVFTSGATESNNLALFGVAHYHAARGKHIVSSRTEHKAVLEPLKRLAKQGYKVTYLKPDADGIVQPDQVAEALRSDTVLVSLMHVNNETGVVQDVGAVGRLCRERGVLLHVDAAQSAGRLPIDVDAMGIDLLSCTAHKMYGPKGIGALYVRRQPELGRSLLGVEAQIIGGDHEFGLRAGTLATHQIVGFGVAMHLALSERAEENSRIAQLRDQLWRGVQAVGGVELNGHATQRAPGILNVAFHGVEGESLLFALRDLAISAGAACSTGSDEASYVLRALGRSDQLAQSSMRFSLGRFSTAADIEAAIERVSVEVHRLRQIAGTQ